MSNERTEQLIVELAGNMTAVNVLPSVAARLARWAAMAGAAGVLAVAMLGPRADLSLVMLNPRALIVAAVAVAAALAAGLEAVRLSVPGAAPAAWTKLPPLLMVALWIAVVEMFAAGTSGESVHAVCMARVVAIAVIPISVLLRDVLRGYVLDRTWAFALAALAGGATAAIAVQFLCPIDQASHVLVSHVAPVAGLALLAAAMAGGLPIGMSRR